MDMRVALLSAVALGAAVFSATAAIAGDVAITGKATSTGTLLKSIGMGNDSLNVYEENGTAMDDGGSHKLRCVWLVPFIKNTVVEPHGYCVYTDGSGNGDQFIAKTTSQTRPLSVGTGSGVGDVMAGTGKYTGMTGGIAFICQFAGTESQYSVNCDTHANYKMP
jgi:hypothetical protein